MASAEPESRPRPFEWVVVAALAVVYYLLLLKDYEYSISPRFRYMQFIFRGVSVKEALVDLIFVVVPTLFLPIRGRRVSEAAIVFIYLIAYVPTILMLSAVGALGSFDLLLMKTTLCVSLAMIALVPALAPNTQLPRFRLTGQSYLLLVLAASAAAFLFIGSKYGFKLNFHALSNVYDQRDAYKAELGGVRFANYFSGILRGATAPILIAAGLHTRRYWLVGAGVFLFMYLYSVMASKSALLGPAYVIVTYYVAKLFPNRFFTICLLGCVGIVGFGWATADTARLSILNDLFVRRVLILQGLLFEYYVEAFQSTEPMLLKHSILGFLGPAPVPDPEGFVGRTQFISTAHANANIFSDGYINLKYPGILLSALFAGGFLAILDRLTERLPSAVAIAACGTMLQMLTQTGLIKTFGSHGGIALCGLLLLMPADFLWSRRERRERRATTSRRDLATLFGEDDETEADDEAEAEGLDEADDFDEDLVDASLLPTRRAPLEWDLDDEPTATSIVALDTQPEASFEQTELSARAEEDALLQPSFGERDDAPLGLQFDLLEDRPLNRITQLQQVLEEQYDGDLSVRNVHSETRRTNDRLADLQAELAGEPVELPGTVGAADGDPARDGVYSPGALPPSTGRLGEPDGPQGRTASEVELKSTRRP